MPVNRLVSLVRSAAAYRVEACFIAALAFTLANQADDRRHTFDVHTATTQHTVVHEVEPVRVVRSVHEERPVERVRVVASRAPVPVVERTRHAARPAKAPLAASGTRFRVVSTGGAKTLVLKTDSAAFSFCSTTSNAAAAVQPEGSCKVIRITPTASGVVIAKTTAAGT